MILLNTSFGKYASLPMGWFFMAILVIIEALIMSNILSNTSLNPRVIVPTIISNTVSGVTGALVSNAINKGWMLVVWFPWVSGNEVNTSDQETLFSFIIYFIAAFIATVFIEIILNGLMMKRRGFKNVMRATVISNVITYLIGCFALYTYSFVFFD